MQPGPVARPACPLLDLYTCLPGLIDMHTHLTDGWHETADLSVYYRRTPAEQGAIARASARDTLLAGFTTVRDVGTYIAWVDRDLRDAINQGSAIGPRMQVAGFYLTIPAAAATWSSRATPESEIPPQVRMGVARGPEQFRQKAELAVAGGADVLKIIASGAVLAFGGVPGEREMTPEEIKAVVDVAHAHGMKVAAHAHGAQSIKDAILAGADTIEHASLIDDEAIALAKRMVSRCRWTSTTATTSIPSAARKNGPRNSCARTSRRRKRSARASPARIAPASTSCTAPTRRCIRTGSTRASFRSWCSVA